MKVALCGSAPSSTRLAPFFDKSFAQWQQGKVQAYPTPPHIGEEWEIWGCSPGFFSVAQRATRWFEVHRWEPGQSWFSPEYVEFLKNFNGPVYTGARIDEIKNHIVYPIEAVEAEFSSYFLTSSLSLMMAIAIMEIEQVRAARKDGSKALPPNLERYRAETDDTDVIGMWGVDMAASEEYGYQRPGCQFFVLEALRRGIGFYLPPESDLMRPMPVYGISEWDHSYIKLTARARELNIFAQQKQQEAQQAQAQLNSLQGEMHQLDSFVKTWTSPYGMRPGMVIRQTPGTGLGGGVTHIDGRPVR